MGHEHQEQDQNPPTQAAVEQTAADEAAPAADGVHTAHDAPEDHGAEVQQDLDELVAKAEKADEYLALAQRTQADFENFRKRMARDVKAAEARGIGKLAKELLPALDNLDRALAAAGSGPSAAPAEGAGEQPDHHLTAGVKLVHDELLAALGRAGIERFSPQGERFDPNEHEAMVQQPVAGAESGTVVEVYQSGYRLGGIVLRPARVVVAA